MWKPKRNVSFTKFAQVWEMGEDSGVFCYNVGLQQASSGEGDEYDVKLTVSLQRKSLLLLMARLRQSGRRRSNFYV
ncbi:unnamed protein product [Orchesella dallaii]|uniref:Uncharacterized protein n=1 Tax=Orchesella dallaii TaxID=48710 RepID=A0ABP1S4R2_9HEXA